jgi:hypothetical protein
LLLLWLLLLLQVVLLRCLPSICWLLPWLLVDRLLLAPELQLQQ